MEEYSITKNISMPTCTVDNIKAYYQAIIQIIAKLQLNENEISVKFSLSPGGLHCVLKSYEKFLEETFGQSICFNELLMCASNDCDNVCFIIKSNNSTKTGSVEIKCNNKLILDKVSDCIKQLNDNNPRKFKNKFWESVIAGVTANIIYAIIPPVLIYIANLFNINL